MNFIADFIRSQSKTWGHDRSATIGASEIGACARKVWFSKNQIPHDEGYIETKGAAMRGDLIERHVWVPALHKWAAENGATVLFAGDDQVTIGDGLLSATPDALVLLADGTCVVREAKSIDPRVNLQEEKSEHFAQVQTQMGLIKFVGEYDPAYAVIDYVNASFLDDVKSFTVQPDPTIYANAKTRAFKIMDAERAIDLRPEGKMAGGRECEYCAWSGRCTEEAVASIPTKADVELGENAATALEEAVQRQLAAKDAGEAAKEARAAAEEDIKEILRAHGARRYEAPTFGVSWSAVKGRSTTDLKAAQAAGIDLSAFTREGAPSERLTIKSKEED